MSKKQKCLELINLLTTEYGPHIYRRLEVTRDKNGKKIPVKRTGNFTKNNMSREEIRRNSGLNDKGINCFDIYLKHCENEKGHLICVDFDDLNYKENPLYIKLYNMKVIETKSKGGCHCYIAVKNMIDYTNEVKVQKPYRAPDGNEFQPETDLIKEKINMWEYYEDDGIWDLEMRGGHILSFEWDELKHYFDEKEMNKSSSKKNIVKPMKTSASEETLREQQIFQCSEKQFKGYLNRLKPHRFHYKQLIDVGIMCFNNFDGSDKGCRIWQDWNSTDETTHDQIRDMEFIMEKWKGFKLKTDGPVADYRKLKKWADEDNPCNPYEEIYKSKGVDAMVHELNTGEENGIRIGLKNDTSEYIIETPTDWHIKNHIGAGIHFEHYHFTVPSEDDPDKSFVVKPFQTWRFHPNKNVWNKVVYDPSGQETGCYNLWKGYKIKPEDCERYDEADAQAILDHIFDIWADGDQERYDYILNWFAHKLQFPMTKMTVCLCLNSGEGAGKNVILNFFFMIMGDNYDSIANANQIIGDFNGVLEGRTLLNFDEVTYGGDHSTNNKLKALITEDYMYINKKNKEAYRIRSLADFIITTNEEYFIGVTGDSRRYCPFQLNGKWVGDGHKDEKEAYFSKIRKCPAEAFAKILYNRDISGFNPRQFKKTELFQQQVERSLNSDIRWLYQVLESGLLKPSAYDPLPWMELLKRSGDKPTNHYELYGNQGYESQMAMTTKWDKLLFKKGDRKFYVVDLLYEIYAGTRMGSYNKTQTPTVFYQTLKTVFGDSIKEGVHPILGKVISLPELDEARLCYNRWARWDYTWGQDVGDEDDDNWDDIVFTEKNENDSDSD